MSQIPPPPPPGGPPMQYQSPSGASTSGMAIGSLICGILSIGLFCMWFLAVPLGAIAIILGIIARGKINRGEATGAGLAMTGIITGAIGLLVSIALIAGAFMFQDELQNWQQEQLDRIEQQQQSAPEPAP